MSLPEKFGGGPTDYQLVESEKENGEDGETDISSNSEDKDYQKSETDSSEQISERDEAPTPETWVQDNDTSGDWSSEDTPEQNHERQRHMEERNRLVYDA